MRNLSKVLALVLSLAFVMTMFSGALYTGKTYSDDADITSAAGKEAITVLSALDIIGGRTDGTYDPTGDVQRQEFAKMITIATTGEATGNFYNAAVPFVDAVAEWALPYVSYCYLNGIMVGHGNNVADAYGNVTGVQAVKMTLVALGYNPKAEGLEGINWKANTIKLAANIGLLKNLESYNMEAALNREGTAILVYNAIYTTVAGSKLTLGEKVFDLLDTRAILVANEKAALGANWTDILASDFKYDEVEYIKYNVAAANQSVFVYRDYEGAATMGGYYVPRAITVNLATGKADLGMAYRVLTTGAQNPTNTNEVRKLYAVLGEIEDSIDYKSVVSKADAMATKDFNAAIDKMVASAAAAMPGTTEADVQNNCFIDGAAKSYADVKAWKAANENSTAPFRYVDNDNDGTWDFVSVSTYTLGSVTKVTEEAYVISGIGTVKIADAGVELAEGDYVAKSALDGVAAYTKLEKFSGVVTAVNNNAEKLGIDKYTYTINGKTYKIADDAKSALVAATTEAANESLMGRGPAAVNAATLEYVVDGSWIVLVNATAETKWDTYAVLVDWYADILGMPQAYIFTEDNEYKHVLVKSINGNQVYNTLNSWGHYGIDNLSLVKVYFDADGYAAIYDYDVALTSDVAKLQDIEYTNVNDTVNYWYNGNDIYMWDNGVVFVSNGEDLKAFYVDEFKTAGGFNWGFINEDAKLYDDELVIATRNTNGTATLKAALVKVPGQMVIPGLQLREGQIWGTIMDVTNVAYTDEDGVYTYTVKILQPWSTATTEITVSTENNPYYTFDKGDIYKLWMDSDSVVRRWELALGKDADNDYVGNDNNGIELKNVTAKRAFYADGVYYVEIEDDNFLTLTIDANTALYTVENLFTDSIKATDYAGVFAALADVYEKDYILWADIDPATGYAYSVWIDKAASLYVTADVTLDYNEDTRTATYTITDVDGVVKTVVDKDVNPDDLKMMDGETVKNVKVSVKLDHATGLYVPTTADSACIALSTVGTLSKLYGVDAVYAQDIQWGKEFVDGALADQSWAVSISTNSANSTYETVYAQHGTDIYWVRENAIRVEKLAAYTHNDQKANVTDVYEEIKSGFVGSFTSLEFNPNNLSKTVAHEDAYTYEQIMIIYQDLNNDGKADVNEDGYKYVDTIILIDLDTATAANQPGNEAYPYVAPADTGVQG